LADPEEALAEINLRDAMNAISDVIQNRPRPLRQYDQIYMRAGDMVLQSEHVARWATDKKLAFLGDGDSVSVAVAYLRARDIVDYGPSKVEVFDFDERIVNAIKRFADRERIDNLDAHLYNCLDPLEAVGDFDYFYTNPPWGASNGGSSVNVFAQRGFELVGYGGEGLLVIADRSDGLPWTEQVLADTQAFAAGHGYYVSRMMQQLHSYHLDDNPELRSCNLHLRAVPGRARPFISERIAHDRRASFYGSGLEPTIRYVRERKRVDYGRAQEYEYELEHWEEAQ
jgi:N4-bis(aminopropyl)spermidine synthase